MTSRQALIFIGGDPPHENAIDFAEPDALVIAADSGWEHALAFGRVPHVLIGDMDSISPEHLRDARARNIEIIEHPVDKDHTDTELALQLAESLRYENIHVVTGGGDRFDHVLSMVHSLVSFSENATVTAQIGQSYVRIVTPREKVTLGTQKNDTVSLIPLGGHAKAVTTTGLKWNLIRSTLKAFASRGVSNVAQGPEITISLRTGVLAVIITPTHTEPTHTKPTNAAPSNPHNAPEKP
jgi:thiamine pyrophosphokinase